MEKSLSVIPASPREVEEKQSEIEEFLQTLPRQKCWSKRDIRKYEGTWYPIPVLKAVLSLQRHFTSKDTDIILASLPKSGTTWLIALLHTMVNRNNIPLDQSPLLTSNPHDLGPLLEFETLNHVQQNDSDPGLLATHIHYEALPESILSSKCKIVYLCRNPLDSLVSYWHFVVQNELTGEHPLPVDEAFEHVVQGTECFGPFWNHNLGYWKASLKNPEKVLFLTYEEMKKNTVLSVKKLADFLGFSFSKDEENGLIQEIIELCSFQNLKKQEINKTGERKHVYRIKNRSFFRKGEVGDWVNYLTPSMAERLEKVMEEKFQGTGLVFDFTFSHQVPFSS